MIMQRRNAFSSSSAHLLIVAVVAVTTGVLVWRMAQTVVSRSSRSRRRKRPIDLAALVTQVRELNRLETASMHVMHVGTITQSYKLVPNALAGDEITFLADGRRHRRHRSVADSKPRRRLALAGRHDRSSACRPPQILVTRVDNESRA